ncbi:radical SAM domain containing protein, putative [Eimeria mitis]|uniref:Radical SAM domain containing protein, putative n=1 Tax=Eimeria mitis TaxID=44415 RepID=U6JUU5_9EIME|nr:radical SAM domain containing protein, putative [Eimeria mitis]CDJ28531.1 radical SAM domain containing protein, putative [Eimeria mitis]
MLALRAADGIDLLHLLTLSAAAAAAAAAISQPAARAAAAEYAPKLLLHPAATIEDLLRCSAAFVDCRQPNPSTAAAAATATAAAAAAAAADVRDASTAAKEGEAMLLLLQQVLPSVLSGAAAFLQNPQLAEIRVYVHPNIQVEQQQLSSRHQCVTNKTFGAACASLLKEIEATQAVLVETEEEGQWRLNVVSGETEAAVVEKATQLIQVLYRHRSSSSSSSSSSNVSCRLLLKAPDGLLLSDAIIRNIYLQLDEACTPIEALLRD